MTGGKRGSAATDRELLEAARGGDDRAFRRLVDAHSAQLHAHCYRMLGSVHDAEDALQESLLRAWRGLPGFERRSSLRSWLYRIATNTCLDAIARRPKRVLPIDYGPAAGPDEPPGRPVTESAWIEPYRDPDLADDERYASPEARYESRESVELAFIAALQHLPARQRAVLILRDVLGFSAAEVAEALEASVAAVNSALQRARGAVEERLPERSQQATLRSLGDERVRAIVDGYVDAWERGDVDAVAAMLADDVAITMPPMATWYRGRDAIGFLSRAFSGRWSRDRRRFESGERRVRLLPIRVNGQLGFAAYHWEPDLGRQAPHVLQALTLEGPRIEEITGFVGPAAFERFGLPDRLAGRDGRDVG